MTSHTLPDSDIWFVRAGAGNVHARFCYEREVVTIGWHEAGPIQSTDSSERLKTQFEAIYPGWWDRELKRFFAEISVGEAAATYDPASRLYHIGIVKSPAEWNVLVATDAERGDRGYIRRVEWVCSISRDDLTEQAKLNLARRGTTVYRLSHATSSELRQRCKGEVPSETLPNATQIPTLENDSEIVADPKNLLQEYIDQSGQLVEDQIAKLGPYQLQDLVAGILRAMGYRTTVSGRGSDRGVDVFASPDGLGLAEPRIFVEVKHQRAPIGAPTVRSFLGGRRPGDRCLYVSTGGFTNEARYEADRSQIPLTLITMPELRELLIDYYETLDSETRALVPLKKVYWPIA